jgi:hypothetical protein
VQHTTTVAFRVREPRRVSKELARIAADRNRDGQPAFFEDLGIHFGRWVLVEEPVTSEFSSWLLFESNFDSDLASRKQACAHHLRAVEQARSAELAHLLEGCDHQGPIANAQVPSTAEYQGHPFRDVARIDLEAKVHRAALDRVSALPPGTSDAKVHEAVRDHVRELGLLDVKAAPPSRPDPVKRARLLRRKIWPWASHFHRVLPALPFAILSAAKEPFDDEYDMQSEAEERGPEREALLLANAASEDATAQNALTHLVPLKKGLIRSLTLRGLHFYLAGVARDHFDYVEMLGGIPSIHFAKWLLIDGGRRLLFFSNYDGGWESYLGDFVDGAAAGLNLAWTCTEGYPRTQLLARGGANDEQRFKAWARAHQRPTEVFYSAYPRSTVATINNATWVRHGLHQKLEGDALAAWRRRLT